MRLSNSHQPKSHRYSDAWDLLAVRTPHLARLHQQDRNATIWVYANREAVLAQREALPPRQRDRWHNPQVVKSEFEKAQTDQNTWSGTPPMAGMGRGCDGTSYHCGKQKEQRAVTPQAADR